MPHGGPALPPRQKPRRGFSWCRLRRPALPHIARPHRFLACPTPPLSMSPFTNFPPPRLLPPPLSLSLLNSLCSHRPTPRSRRRSPPGRPLSRNALPCCRHCLPDPGAASVPVFRAPAPPFSSSLRTSSSFLSLSRRAAALFRPQSSLLLRRFSPLTTSGPCGHLPLPARPFPRPRPPISPVENNMLAIRQAGL